MLRMLVIALFALALPMARAASRARLGGKFFAFTSCAVVMPRKRRFG